MKLSEAIRMGSMVVPQTHGEYYIGEWPNPVAACAMGAAFIAVGDKTCSDHKHWPWMRVSKWHNCPSPSQCRLGYDGPVLSVVLHLNDEHGWTRERIADWVATVEPKEIEVDADEPIRTRAVPCNSAGGDLLERNNPTGNRSPVSITLNH